MEDSKYYRVDLKGNFLTSSEKIDYFKYVQFNEIIRNGLLGNYDNEGYYILESKIIKPLVNIKKRFVRQFNDSIFVKSINKTITGKRIEFVIKTYSNKPQKGYSTAYLILLERINKTGGEYQNTQETVIDKYTDSFDEHYLDKVYEAFNVINEERDRFDNDQDKAQYIVFNDRIRMLDKIRKSVDVSTFSLTKKLFNYRISVLKSDPNIDPKLIDKLIKEVENIQKNTKKNETKTYIKLNELLDQFVEIYEKELDDKTIKKLNKAESIYSNECDKIIKNSVLENKIEEKVIIEEKEIKEQAEDRSDQNILTKSNVLKDKPEINSIKDENNKSKVSLNRTFKGGKYKIITNEDKVTENLLIDNETFLNNNEKAIKKVDVEETEELGK